MSRSAPPRPRPIEIGPLRASTMKRWREVNGSVRWYWRARRKGSRDTAWTGWATREEVQQVLAEMVTVGLPEPADPTPRSIRTVGELLEAWFARQQRRQDLSPKTVRFYEKAARHLVAWLREVLCARVDRETLEGYRDDRLGENAAPRLVQQELKVLNMAWRWAQGRGLLTSRALPRVRVKIDGYVINHHTPSPGDIPPVLAQLSGDAALAVRLLAVTGARVSEVCALRGRDLERTTATLALRGKTGLRRFPLPEELLDRLVAQDIEPEEAVFSLGRVPAETLRGQLKRACSRAGVEPFTPHGLRRMVVNRLIRRGVDVATAASLTGHSVVVMLRYYREVSEDERRAAVFAANLLYFPSGEVVHDPQNKTT